MLPEPATATEQPDLEDLGDSGGMVVGEEMHVEDGEKLGVWLGTHHQ